MITVPCQNTQTASQKDERHFQFTAARFKKDSRQLVLPGDFIPRKEYAFLRNINRCGNAKSYA